MPIKVIYLLSESNHLGGHCGKLRVERLVNRGKLAYIPSADRISMFHCILIPITSNYILSNELEKWQFMEIWMRYQENNKNCRIYRSIGLLIDCFCNWRYDFVGYFFRFFPLFSAYTNFIWFSAEKQLIGTAIFVFLAKWHGAVITIQRTTWTF